MLDLLKKYDYSKQFIFLEDADKKIQKKLNSDDELINVDDYQWTVVTTVSTREVDGVTYYLLQHEDKEIGWCQLEDSIQIYRFPARHFQVIEEKFTTNELNKNMNIDKDFISHFKGKLLSVKSQIFYNDRIYFSVFIKSKFHGFHDSDVLDELIPCEIDMDPQEVAKKTDIHAVSSLEKPVHELNIESIKVVSVFKENQIGKVEINNEAKPFWISTKNIDIDLDLLNNKKQPIEDVMLNDIFQSLKLERRKSKEIVKNVLAAREYLNESDNKQKDIKQKHLQSSFKNAKKKSEAFKEQNDTLIKENRELKDKLLKEQKLHEERHNHQMDYRRRLEAQRDKYKDRMIVVEDKLKNLNDKYKALKAKFDTQN